MTPDEWNEAKSELPVGDKADSIKALAWLTRWWRPMALHIDRCMAEHEKSIFASTKWVSGEAHLRNNHRRPGQVVAQLPIVVELAEIDIMLNGLEEIREALIKAGEKP